MNSILRYLTNKFEEILGLDIYKPKQIENMTKVRGQVWMFYKELEEEIRNWINDVEMEVPELIRKTGRKVIFLLLYPSTKAR